MHTVKPETETPKETNIIVAFGPHTTLPLSNKSPRKKKLGFPIRKHGKLLDTSELPAKPRGGALCPLLYCQEIDPEV